MIRKYLAPLAGLIAGVFLLGVAPGAKAGDDPSIKGDLRTGIQSAMNEFVEQQSVNDVVRLYDAVDGGMLELKFAGLPKGIVKKGDFYVSCADFVDQKDRKIDVDFLVIPDGHGKLRVTQGLVHSIDGNKRKYHLEAD